MNWPAFLPDQIIKGNPDSHIAVVCGWAQRDTFLKKLERAWDLLSPGGNLLDSVAAIGNLYSASRGIDILIRNLLANPKIRVLIFAGSELSNATRLALDLFDHPEDLAEKDDHYTLPRREDLKIWNNIPLGKVMSTVTQTLTHHAKSVEEVVRVIVTFRTHDILKERKTLDAMEIAPPRINPPSLPTPYNIHPIRMAEVGPAWLELLYQIMTFGVVIDTHYGETSRELMNLAVVISNQKPTLEEGDLPEYIPFDMTHLEEYYPRLLTNVEDPDVTYVYGNLIRAYFGVDQVKKVAMKLAEDESSRSAVISLWDPNWKRKHSPCLNHIWFRLMDGALFMTAIIRSNDMFFGWPENAFGLRKLQDTVRALICAHKGDYQDDKRYTLGDLTIISQSAHLYYRDWGPALEIVEKYRRPKEHWDEKGQFMFEVFESEDPKAYLIKPDGPIVWERKGTPKELMRAIANDRLVSDIGHALWVGFQLGKMEGGHGEQERP